VRLLLFTGKGGVGKTTASAATAAAAAARGSKTLVLSTDPAHSLADALGRPLTGEPTEVDTGLYAMQVDTQAAFDRVLAHQHSAAIAWDRIHPNHVGHSVLARAFLDGIGFDWTGR